MQVVLAEPAERDLVGIIDYIALDNPEAAKTVFDAITAALRRLGDFPGMGRAGRVPGTRELPVANLPYVIVYTAAPEVVTVVAVFHTAMDLRQAIADRDAAIKG
ncbi:MAG: type II toxin-antitoxin system RelE/ParE family toxin [Geminicoccaceae bacterium]